MLSLAISINVLPIPALGHDTNYQTFNCVHFLLVIFLHDLSCTIRELLSASYFLLASNVDKNDLGEANFLGGVARVKGVKDFSTESAKKRFFEIYLDKV